MLNFVYRIRSKLEYSERLILSIFNPTEAGTHFTFEMIGTVEALNCFQLLERTALILQVEDQGDPVRRASMICSINVKDTNNQSPVFTIPTTSGESVFVDEVDHHWQP